jgi:hypothetical protein
MLNLLLSRYHQIKGDSSAGEAHPKREGTEYGHCEPLIFPHLPSPPVAKIISTALTVHKDEDWAQAATRLLTIAGIETNQVEVSALIKRLFEQNMPTECNSEKCSQILRLDITDPVVQQAIMRIQ